MEWLTLLEETAWVSALRDSTWVYPFVNAGHILGIALLIGGILPLDLRLLGTWPAEPLSPLWRILTRCAAAGLILAMLCGFLLFVTDPTEYLQSDFFIAKLLFIVVGIANAVLLRIAAPIGIARLPGDTAVIPVRLRLSALISIIAWLTALILGRLVGYF